MRVTALLLAALAALSLVGCSSQSDQSTAQPALAVNTVMPVKQTFHTKVTAFGQLAADSRQALSLSLPQAGKVIATEVVAGQSVTRGEPLLKLKTSPADRSAYLQAQNGVKSARQNLTHVQHLHADKLATNAEVDTALKGLADAEAAFAAQAELGGASPTATLKAPSGGVITAIDVQLGQRLSAGTPLVGFTPHDALAALLGVPPDLAASIRPGMPVTVKPVFGSTDGVSPLSGTIAVVGDAVNPKTDLVDVVATLGDPPKLAAGSILSGVISTNTYQAWAIPRDALENDAQGDYVFQIEHGKAKRVNVRVLSASGSPIAVSGAIDPHAPVVTVGSYEISAGQAVKPAPAKGSHASDAKVSDVQTPQLAPTDDSQAGGVIAP